MKQRLNSCMLAVLACTALFSCGNSHKRTAEDAARKATVVKDTTLYARIDRHSEDTLYVTAIADGRRHSFGYAEAKRSGHMAGSPIDGDTVAAMPDFGQHKMKSVINISQLKGLWMDEIDRTSGMRLTADGGAYSIGAGQETLRSWHIANGRIILTYVGSPESNTAEKSEEANITCLDAATLALNFDGKLRVYKRQIGLISE